VGAEADIARARRKPLSEDKLRELLLKARKGATSSFTFGKLVQIWDALGWQVVAAYGWTPLHYTSQGKEMLVTDWTGQNPREIDVQYAEERRLALIAASVSSLPEAGPETVGERVVMDVGPMKIGSNGIRYFERREWVGTEGLKITSPRGQEAELLPDHHEASRSKCLTDLPGFASGGPWKWLKETGIEDDINAFLKMEKHIPAAERTRDNTGTCAHCWGNYKLDGGLLVLHGYKRPRWGYAVGQCSGVRYRPLEESPDGARDQLERLRGYLEQWKRTFARLEHAEVIELEHFSGRKITIRKDEPMFEVRRKEAQREAEQAIKEIKQDVTLYEKVLDCWHAQPLPRQGELQRGPGFFTKQH